jgi:N-acetyl-gamma-glutamyl-phosphate reductase
VISVGIINVSGYAGVELARLLLRHPQARVTQVTGRSEAGKSLAEVFPHLAEIDLTIQPELDQPVDVAFVALPHKAAAAVVPDLLASGAKVVDISADFRLHDVRTYEEWYQVTHPCPDLLAEAVYGLPELHREAVRAARLVANPGCYPTASILALAPIAPLLAGPVVVDAKSGISGGGRSLTLTNHYSEVNENCLAYSVSGHRHLPEITQELAELRSELDRPASDVIFLPHLVPMTRGILASCYAPLADQLSAEAMVELYRDFYRGHPFVRVVAKPPQTKQTAGSNLCLIYPTIDKRTGHAIVLACIDNLVKGASGQAIQNMNLMVGLGECDGIDAPALYP